MRSEAEKPANHLSAKELYDAVLQPVAQWQTTKRMFVVPDGKLHLLPFDSLLTLNSAPAHIVTLVPSANVWYLLRTRPRRTVPERPLLAVGGVPYDRMFAGTPTLRQAPSGRTKHVGCSTRRFRRSCPSCHPPRLRCSPPRACSGRAASC